MRALLPGLAYGRKLAAGAGQRRRDLPEPPVRIVVPFPAAARPTSTCASSARSSASCGPGLVIENRPGANTGIGAQRWRSRRRRLHAARAMDTTLVMNPQSTRR